MTSVIFFLTCPLIAAFWSDILDLGMQQLKQFARSFSYEILYGYKPNESKFYVLNHFLLLIAQHVSTFQQPALSIQKQIAVQNNKLVEFGRKWSVLSQASTVLPLVLSVFVCFLYLFITNAVFTRDTFT